MIEVPPEEVEKLRRALAAPGSAGEGCPPADTIFAAAHGELAPEQLGAVLDHVAECSACTEAWLLAVELSKEAAPAGKVLVGDFASRPRRRWSTVFGSLAALLLAALLLPYLRHQPGPSPDPVERGEGKFVIVDESLKLDRRHCVLRWRLEPVAPGARFEVTVMNEKLEEVAALMALSAGELVVAPEVLEERVPPGGFLLWRV